MEKMVRHHSLLPAHRGLEMMRSRYLVGLGTQLEEKWKRELMLFETLMCQMMEEKKTVFPVHNQLLQQYHLLKQ